MKRLIPAAAVLLAFSASAYAVEPSFNDSVALTAEDAAPRPGAVPAWEIRKHFPKGSFAGGNVAVTPDDLAPRANSVSSAKLISQFPQPSFRDAEIPAAGTADRYAGAIAQEGNASAGN